MASDPHSRAQRLQILNSDLAERAFRKGSGLAIHRPVHVYLQIASACNLECYMCTEHNRPPELRRGHGLRSLSPEIFGRIEREVLPWSTRLSLGVGGEPTISEHFIEYLERGARAGQEIHLTTNGTRLENERVAEAVARHVRRLQISIDAATPATYERIRLGGRWANLRRGLLRLKEKRAQLGTRASCHVTLCFVLMRSNVDELPAFVELAREVDADAVWAQHVIPATDEARDEPLIAEPERYDRVLEIARARADELGIALDAPLPFASAAREREAASTRVVAGDGHAVPCRFPAQALFVLYDGRVFPCCHPFAHQKMQVGDLSKQSFAEIWNDRVYRNLRAGMRSGDLPPICRSCSLAHDPPLEYEDPAQLLAGPELSSFYGTRELQPLEPADPLAGLIESGWIDWADDALAHAEALESERNGLAGHAANLERELAPLGAHASTLESERAHLKGHLANLEPELEHQRAHAANLERRIGDLERSCDSLEEQARQLGEERERLMAHAANLERERSGLHERMQRLRGFSGALRFAGQALTGPLAQRMLRLRPQVPPKTLAAETRLENT